MTDINNTWVSWGSSGTAPPTGFEYAGGDRVREDHLDFLWDNSYEFADMLVNAVTERVDHLFGDVVLDTGLKVTDGGGRVINISTSNLGAYVNGQQTGSISGVSITLNSNSSGSTRTDSVWVREDGTLGRTSNTTTVQSDRMKLAEVDVNTSNDIVDIRNYGRDLLYTIASEEEPDTGSTQVGIWYDKSNEALKVLISGVWYQVFTENSTLKTADDILASDDTVIWDESEGHIPASIVEQGAGSSLNADTLDGQHYSDIQSWVNNNADVPNADHADDADTVDDLHGGEHPIYADLASVPNSLAKGTIVFVDDSNTFYYEDGV